MPLLGTPSPLGAYGYYYIIFNASNREALNSTRFRYIGYANKSLNMVSQSIIHKLTSNKILFLPVVILSMYIFCINQ